MNLKKIIADCIESNRICSGGIANLADYSFWEINRDLASMLYKRHTRHLDADCIDKLNSDQDVWVINHKNMLVENIYAFRDGALNLLLDLAMDDGAHVLIFSADKKYRDEITTILFNAPRHMWNLEGGLDQKPSYCYVNFTEEK